jgi:hypothetical protein
VKPTAILLLAGCFASIGCSADDNDQEGPLRVAPPGFVGQASGPDVRGAYSIPSTRVVNDGGGAIRVLAATPIWDRDSGRPPGRKLGAFVLGEDADLDWGEEKGWPPETAPAARRRAVPGAELAAGEEAQVWIGVRPPAAKTGHLLSISLKYEAGGRAYQVELPAEMWFCVRQSGRSCSSQADDYRAKLAR